MSTIITNIIYLQKKYFRTFHLPFCPCPMECAPCFSSPTTTTKPTSTTTSTSTLTSFETDFITLEPSFNDKYVTGTQASFIPKNATILTPLTIPSTSVTESAAKYILNGTKNDELNPKSGSIMVWLNGFCYIYSFLITVYCFIVSLLFSKNTQKFQRLNQEYIEFTRQMQNTPDCFHVANSERKASLNSFHSVIDQA